MKSVFFFATLCFANSLWAQTSERPNVLFIAIDDLNDWVGVFGGHPQVKTPNLDAFAQAGSVVFQNAHCAGPVCGSSRSALLSGFMPSTTGIYGNGQNMRSSKIVRQHATLPEYFSKQGYRTLSCGKIFHAHTDEEGRDVGHWAFDHYERIRSGARVDKSKYTSRNANIIAGKPGPDSAFTKRGGSEFAWGPTRGTVEETRDYKAAEWGASQLQETHEQPFFIALGLSRPHLPFYVPQKFFDRYDASTFKAPDIKEDDLEDITIPGKNRPKFQATDDYLWLKQNGLIDEAARAYAAATSYADECLGVVFDELANSPYRDNTIVVIWGDHGWHLGEKLRYRKTTGWSESTRVPLLVRMPGMNGQQDCARPVNLIDLYPTLIELCGLPDKTELDGRDFSPLLEDPQQTWDHPTLTVFGRGNASIHRDRYHYLRYRDGTEEFYDLHQDPMEWDNLIARLNSQQQLAKARLAKFVPVEFADALENNLATKDDLKDVKQLNPHIKKSRDLSILK